VKGKKRLKREEMNFKKKNPMVLYPKPKKEIKIKG